MKLVAHMIVAIAMFAGYSVEEPESKEVSSAAQTLEKPEEPTISGLTEERKAALAQKFGLKKPGTSAAGRVSFSVDFGISWSAPEVSFNMKGITNQSETAVKALLGTPIKTETGEWTLHRPEEKTTFTRHVYAAEIGEVKVIFIKGKAVRIEVKPKEAFTFPDDAIKAMRAAGLTVRDGLEPESGGTHFLDFAGIDGVYAVRVFEDLEGSPGNIGYVQIVTEERYK